jgi:DNA-directed RNA polymerase specialized sigma24 family protein
VYLVRTCRVDNSDTHFESLYRILMARILDCLPRAESADGKTLSLTRSRIREQVFDRFTELLAADREGYLDKLDYFEVRFDGALASLRRDAQEKAWRDENRSTSLEFDEETGELSAEVERAVGSFDPFEAAEMGASDYRSRLDAAIDTLQPGQRRIIEMIRQGIPIDSKEAGAVTIAKALGKSEKTIRTHRDKAFVALRAAMTQREES